MAEADRAGGNFAKIVGTGVVAVAVVGVAALVLGGPKKVGVQYVGGADCVRQDPYDPEIFQDRWQNLLKPKKVKWVVEGDEGDAKYWAFTYQATSPDPKKPAGMQNWLGPVPDIDCKGSKTTSGKAPKDQGKDVTWPYAITVYECRDGVQGDELCTLDPVIWIRE